MFRSSYRCWPFAALVLVGRGDLARCRLLTSCFAHQVDTVKRTCIKKLPPTLCIQLKRFDYDWERECAIKFNDYFEFPRQLDMEPYTGGLERGLY